MPADKDKLKQFVNTYKQAFKQAGGRDEDVKDEQTIIQKMESRQVQDENSAKQAGQQDGQQSKSQSSQK